MTENESQKKDKEIDPVITEMEDQTTWFSVTEKDQKLDRRNIDNMLTILSLQYCQQHFTLLYSTSNSAVQNTTSLSMVSM